MRLIAQRYYLAALGIVLTMLILAMCAALGGCHLETRSVPSQPTDAPRAYYAYLPLVRYAYNIRHGVALSRGDCADVRRLRAGWLYAWYPQPLLCSGVESVPMVRDAAQLAALESGMLALGGNSEYVMLLNEPEYTNQANLSPEDAARLTRRVETLYPHARIVSPATMAGLGQHARALAWMRAWYAAYVTDYGNAPRVDAVAYHWYGWTDDDARAALDEFTALADEWGVGDIWITEIAFLASETDTRGACYGWTEDAARAEASKFFNYLHTVPRVTRYAWYAPRLNIESTAEAFAPPQCNASLLDWRTGAPTAWSAWYVAQAQGE